MTRFCLILFVCLLILPAAATHAQTENSACTTNRNSPPLGPYRWARDSEIKVYFRETFTAPQRAALIAAMDAWMKAVPNSGMKFSYAGETQITNWCDNCLTVQKREINKFDKKHYAFFNAGGVDRAGRLTSGSIDLDFATTNPQALQSFMVHELGHSLGLGDCPNCKTNQTIMNSYPGINRDNGLIEPSTCDREAVNRIYEADRPVARNNMGENNQ